MKLADVTNRYAVAYASDGIVTMLSPPAPRQKMSRQDALNLAAWLTVIANIEDGELLAARRDVEAT